MSVLGKNSDGIPTADEQQELDFWAASNEVYAGLQRGPAQGDGAGVAGMIVTRVSQNVIRRRKVPGNEA
jgi:hypothetical protein